MKQQISINDSNSTVQLMLPGMKSSWKKAMLHPKKSNMSPPSHRLLVRAVSVGMNNFVKVRVTKMINGSRSWMWFRISHNADVSAFYLNHVFQNNLTFHPVN